MCLLHGKNIPKENVLDLIFSIQVLMNNFKDVLHFIPSSSSIVYGSMAAKKGEFNTKVQGLWINWPNQWHRPLAFFCTFTYIYLTDLYTRTHTHTANIMLCVYVRVYGSLLNTWNVMCSNLSGIAVGWLMALVRWNRKSFLLIFIFLCISLRLSSFYFFFKFFFVLLLFWLVVEMWKRMVRTESGRSSFFAAAVAVLNFYSFQQRFVDNAFHLIY